MPLTEPNDLRLVIAMDFGTTHTGVAYATPGRNEDILQDIHVITQWPGSSTDSVNVPTRIEYSTSAQPRWGFHVPDKPPCLEWSKFLLDPEYDGTCLDSKSVEVVYADYLQCLWEHTTKVLRRDLGSDMLTTTTMELVFIVPTKWSEQGKSRLQAAMSKAGLGSRDCDNILIVHEYEAAACAILAASSRPTIPIARDLALQSILDMIRWQRERMLQEEELRKEEALRRPAEDHLKRLERITPESLRDLRDLIRTRYALDVEIWSSSSVADASGNTVPLSGFECGHCPERSRDLELRGLGEDRGTRAQGDADDEDEQSVDNDKSHDKNKNNKSTKTIENNKSTKMIKNNESTKTIENNTNIKKQKEDQQMEVKVRVDKEIEGDAVDFLIYLLLVLYLLVGH